jgi:hypothetical protein
MTIDLTKIAGEKKRVWWMDAATGRYTDLGEYPSQVLTFQPHASADGVLIAFDSNQNYL